MGKTVPNAGWWLKRAEDSEIRVLKTSSNMDGEVIMKDIKGRNDEESCKPGTW